jgi:hypothetical protein
MQSAGIVMAQHCQIGSRARQSHAVAKVESDARRLPFGVLAVAHTRDVIARGRMCTRHDRELGIRH